jgi:DNA-binding protein HU-beta
MNKSELIEHISRQADISRSQVTTVLKCYHETIASTLAEGKSVGILGFGTFSVSERSERIGRNPKTGEALKIKAKKVARFKPGKELSSKL